MTSELPPFSKSAHNNREHILEQLKRNLNSSDTVLEVASGTGQHAVYFTEELPELNWQASDVDMTSFALADTLAQFNRSNLLAPMVLDIDNWPDLNSQYDAVYSANCIHIIGEELLEPYVAGAAASLKAGGAMLLYGPYKYGGEFTTASNAEFDVFLSQTYSGGGIKDFETVDRLANMAGMKLESDTAMPANNQFLVWRKMG